MEIGFHRMYIHYKTMLQYVWIIAHATLVMIVLY